MYIKFSFRLSCPHVQHLRKLLHLPKLVINHILLTYRAVVMLQFDDNVKLSKTIPQQCEFGRIFLINSCFRIIILSL